MRKVIAAAIAGVALMGGAGPAAAAEAACEAKAEKAGKKVFKRCAACHKVDEGKHGIGPSLHNIVGRAVGSIEGFKYSKALKGYAEKESEGGEPATWTEDRLHAFITKPKAEIKGTKMVFAGLKGKKEGDKKETQRANLICYLKSISADGAS